MLYRTFKCGCPVHISASVDRDKGKLVVLSVELQHSHATVASIASSYPENGQRDANDHRIHARVLKPAVARIDCSLLKDAPRKPLIIIDVQNKRVIIRKAAAGGTGMLFEYGFIV